MTSISLLCSGCVCIVWHCVACVVTCLSLSNLAGIYGAKGRKSAQPDSQGLSVPRLQPSIRISSGQVPQSGPHCESSLCVEAIL